MCKKRPFEEKRSPSKTLVVQKQHFKQKHVFVNEEAQLESRDSSQTTKWEIPLAGKIKDVNTTKKARRNESKISISDGHAFQDEISVSYDSNLLAKHISDTSQNHISGKLIHGQ